MTQNHFECLLRTIIALFAFSSQMDSNWKVSYRCIYFSLTSLKYYKQDIIYLWIWLYIDTSVSLCKTWETVFLSLTSSLSEYNFLLWIYLLSQKFLDWALKLNPTGAIWQNEHSQEVLNHFTNQRKGETQGPDSCLSTQCPYTSFSKQIILCFKKDSLWWTYVATPEWLLSP